MNSALRLSKLVHRYGSTLVLDGIDLTIHRGEVVAIMGASGCGKSTLLRCVVGVQAIFGGDVWFFEQQVIRNGAWLYSSDEFRQHVVLTGQGLDLLPHCTAAENIEIPLRTLRGMSRAEAQRSAVEIGEQLGIRHVLSQFPSKLSGGERQRALLARAAILRPRLLLLDEVTSNLDPVTTKEVTDALWSLRQLPGGADQTILLVTHLAGFASRYSNRVAFMNGGRITDCVPSEQLFATSKSQAFERFLRAAAFLAGHHDSDNKVTCEADGSGEAENQLHW